MTAEFQRLLTLMQQRRSIRRFFKHCVPDEAVDLLMETVRWAPSAGNHQRFRFIAVTHPELRQALAQAVSQEVEKILGRVRSEYREQAARYSENLLFFAQAPLLMAPIYRRGAPLLNMLCEQPAISETDADLEALSSVSAAVMQLLLAVHALGLGACWMTGPLIARKALEHLLQVPPGWVLSALIPIGYPAESPPAPKRRSITQLLQRMAPDNI